MLFNSIEFLVFFIFVYTLYILFPHRWQNRLLIVSSLIFYAAWSWKFLIVMIISITTDFFCSRRIDSESNERKRKLYLGLSLFVNFSILFFFKYFNFFLGNVSSILNFIHVTETPTNLFVNIILPVGISFYTFEAVSYVVDVYRKEIKPAQNYWDYLLFVIYFPHLVAGPIMRGKSFLPQISFKRRLSWAQVYEGGHLFLWGLFEKIFVADNMGKIVNPIFGNPGPYEGSSTLIALYAFTFQIMCDFDGYSNMARGLGKCMGFDIAVNFNCPYFATNPKDFWQRWHITLSTWLRDYLYIPLGGSHHGKSLMYRNLLITMVLGGIWHGASWTFVVWGLFHGIILVIHRWWSDQKVRSAGELAVPLIVRQIFFFHIVVLGWLIFRAQSVDQILRMIFGICANFQLSPYSVSLSLKFLFYVTPVVIVQWWQFKSKDLLVLMKQHWVIRPLFYSLMVYLIIVWGANRPETFIYFQF